MGGIVILRMRSVNPERAVTVGRPQSGRQSEGMAAQPPKIPELPQTKGIRADAARGSEPEGARGLVVGHLTEQFLVLADPRLREWRAAVSTLTTLSAGERLRPLYGRRSGCSSHGHLQFSADLTQYSQ
jgi:hypothetical protein